MLTLKTIAKAARRRGNMDAVEDFFGTLVISSSLALTVLGLPHPWEEVFQNSLIVDRAAFAA
jgi:hypothetical protein